ncbi:MAG TPA: ISAs1 family transposase [Blastocatellia bacterium]|nr:ISAs1 family transposase [Blastocatellia bacterium]
MWTKRIPPLREALAEIADFRQASGRRYELTSILLLACVAMMCGARSEQAIADWGENYGRRWLQRLGIKRQRGPSQSTIHRVLKGIDCRQLEAALARWSQSVLGMQRETTAQALEGVAMDGKTLRGAKRQRAADVHLLSLCSHRLGLVLNQVAVSDHHNELTHREELLADVMLHGYVVTGDALVTHKEAAAQITAQGGDYLLVVKDNQPTLRAEIELVFHTTTLQENIETATTTSTHGGRIERRTLQTSDALKSWDGWAGLEQVLRLQRTVTEKKTGQTRQEIAHAICSVSRARATAAELLALWRGQWTIENRLHWVRDVTFDEDRSQVRTQRIPQVMAALRNTAIALLRLQGEANIAAACRRYAARPALAFAAIRL